MRYICTVVVMNNSSYMFAVYALKEWVATIVNSTHMILMAVIQYDHERIT
jgi:hypothetical protein